MFHLNLVDYPMFSLLLSTWNDLRHLPDTQGYYKVIYLDYVGRLRPSKSYWRGGLGFGLGLGLWLVNNQLFCDSTSTS